HAAGLRRGPGNQLPAPAAGLPLTGHPGQGDRLEPAVGAGFLWPDDAGFPAWRWRRSARLQAGRPDRPLDPANALRDPLRALDGLPHLPPEPDQGALRSDGRQSGFGGPWPALDGLDHHRRGADHGGRLRRLRPGRPGQLPADGLRPGGRGRAGRNDRAHRAGAVLDGAARQAQLVLPELAGVAAENQRRRQAGDARSRRRPCNQHRRLTGALPGRRHATGRLTTSRLVAVIGAVLAAIRGMAYSQQRIFAAWLAVGATKLGYVAYNKFLTISNLPIILCHERCSRQLFRWAAPIRPRKGRGGARTPVEFSTASQPRTPLLCAAINFADAPGVPPPRDATAGMG